MRFETSYLALAIAFKSSPQMAHIVCWYAYRDLKLDQRVLLRWFGRPPKSQRWVASSLLVGVRTKVHT